MYLQYYVITVVEVAKITACTGRDIFTNMQYYFIIIVEYCELQLNNNTEILYLCKFTM